MSSSALCYGAPVEAEPVCGVTSPGSCICVSEPDHDGPHTCACGGQWDYDDLGDFVYVTDPGVAWGWEW